MIDEKPLIEKLNKRIDDFVKSHPEKKGCAKVETVREFIHMIELEEKEQNLRKE